MKKGLSYEKDMEIFGRIIDREYEDTFELFTFSCSLCKFEMMI